MFTKSQIKELLLSYTKKNSNDINWKKVWCGKDNKLLKESIDMHFSNLNIKFIEKAYRIIYDIDELLICPVCKAGIRKFQNFKIGFRPVCSVKCSGQLETTKEKRKQTNLIKYGHENVFQNTSIKEKSKKTLLEKHGADNISKTAYFSEKMSHFYNKQTDAFWKARKEKTSKTSIEKYNTNHPSSSTEVKQKVKDTFLQRYGVDHYFKTDIFQENLKSLCREKYQADNYFSSLEGKEKIKKVFREKYGVENPSHIPGISNKRKQTSLERYGREWFQQCHIPQEIIDITADYNLSIQMLDNLSIVEMCRKYAVSLPWLAGRLNTHGLWNPSKSYLEKDLRQWLIDNQIPFRQNDRKTINPLEIDFLVDDKLGIEINGLFVHSELWNPDRNYHKRKMEQIRKAGILGIMIFEHEYVHKSDIVLSIVKSKLGLNATVMARKCSFYYPTSLEKNTFLIDNHIQGSDKSSYSLALKYNNEIVAVMTFSKPRFSKHAQVEMVRFCSKKGLTVVGGMSKLFQKAQQELCFESCITYADLRFGLGKSYEKLGFELQNFTSPNYWYFSKKVNNFDFNVESRVKYQKHKLKKIFDNFDTNLTEWQNMKNNGFNRFWDCGNARYFWKKK